MTQRKSTEPLYKVTMNFYESDYLWMKDRFPTIGAQLAIRNLVRQFRHRTEAKIATAEPLADSIEVDIEI